MAEWEKDQNYTDTGFRFSVKYSIAGGLLILYTSIENLYNGFKIDGLSSVF